MSDQWLTDDQAATLVAEQTVTSLGFFPSGVELHLGDGRTLCLYEGDREHGRMWLVERA